MAKTNLPLGQKPKGKAVASTSKSKGKPRVSKQRKLVPVVEEVDEEPVAQVHLERLRREQLEREEEERNAPPRKYIWRDGALSQYDKHLQIQFYHEKIDNQKGKKEAFICEREVIDSEFRPFGIIQKFEALGWEAVLKCYDGEKDSVYMEMVQEWVASLDIDWGETRKEMSLSGTVKGIPVVMSQKTLNSIASFDTKASNRYSYPDEELLYRNPKKHPRWDKMVDELYEPGHGNKLERDYMKLPVRLMLIFLVHNVMPRRSDMQGVKLWDIPILYSLMTGTQLVSYRYLVMMNIWDARERKEKKIIPHYRLITALIKKSGALYSGAMTIDKELFSFTCKNIHKHGWVFQKTDQYLILKYGETKTWRVRNPESQVSDDDDLDDHVTGTDGVSYSIPPQTIFTGPYQPSGREFGDQVYPFGGGYPNMSQFVEQA